MAFNWVFQWSICDESFKKYEAVLLFLMVSNLSNVLSGSRKGRVPGMEGRSRSRFLDLGIFLIECVIKSISDPPHCLPIYGHIPQDEGGKDLLRM